MNDDQWKPTAYLPIYLSTYYLSHPGHAMGGIVITPPGRWKSSVLRTNEYERYRTVERQQIHRRTILILSLSLSLSFSLPLSLSVSVSIPLLVLSATFPPRISYSLRLLVLPSLVPSRCLIILASLRFPRMAREARSSSPRRRSRSSI